MLGVSPLAMGLLCRADGLGSRSHKVSQPLRIFVHISPQPSPNVDKGA